MAELTVDDLDAYTKGRLSAGDDETQRLLDSALAAARRYCGWWVTPVIEDEDVIVDGPDCALLVLPTLQLVELTVVTEDGVDLDVTELAWSTRGLVRKIDDSWWTDTLGGIGVTMTHGYDNAADWQSAVLQLADRMSLDVGGRLASKRVDDVEYRWAIPPSMFETSLLDPYRLDPIA